MCAPRPQPGKRPFELNEYTTAVVKGDAQIRWWGLMKMLRFFLPVVLGLLRATRVNHGELTRS